MSIFVLEINSTLADNSSLDYDESTTIFSNASFSPCSGAYYRSLDTFTNTVNYLLLLLGLFGNTMSIIVFASTSMKKLPHSPLMIGLNISDTVYLVVHTTTLVIVYDTEIEQLGHVNFIVNKIRRYTETTTGTVSLLYVTSFTLQRFFMVQYPHRFLCKKALHYRVHIAIGIPIVMSIIYVTVVYDYGAVKIVKSAYVLLFRAIPGIIVITLNIFMMCKLRRSSIKRKSMTFGNYTDSTSKANRLLFVICTFMITLNLPYALIYIYIETMTKYKVPCRLYGLDSQPPFWLEAVYQCACVLYDFNFAINFFLYCFSGGRFRNAVISLFKKVTFVRTSSARSDATHVTTVRHDGTVVVVHGSRRLTPTASSV